jgi:protease-4
LCAAASARDDEPTVAPTSGVQQPANSSALDDQPTALSDSPGGLAFSRGLELDYLRQQAWAARGTSGDALLGAFSLGPLVIGAGVEWLTPQACPFPGCANDRGTRTSLGIALGGKLMGIGAVHHWMGNTGNFLVDDLGAWDVGAMLRPSRHLSLSFTALDVNAPRFGQTDLPRRYVAGVGVRPFGERLTIGADAVWQACAGTIGIPCGVSNPGFKFVGDLELARGVRLIGQVTRNAQLDHWSGQLGLGFDLSHAGLRFTQSIENNAGAQSYLKLRFSEEAWRSIEADHAALVKLDDALAPGSPSVASLIFGGGRRDPHAETLGALRRLARDPGVKAVVLTTSGLPGSLGRAEELRRGIEALRASGKKVLFFLESANDLEYYVASAADRILAAPQAVLAINGFSATLLFAAAGLSKLGVKAEFVRVGAYKNAPDLFTREEISAEQREVEDALLGGAYARYVHAVATRRNVPEEKFKALLDRGLLRPTEAVEAGLLDGLGYPDQLESEVGKMLGHTVALREVSVPAEAERQERWGPKPRIAIIRVEGDIMSGESRSDPFGFMRSVGSTTVSRQIRKAADDPGVKAIVVRIDSPGGDGNASDLIWRELIRARKEKGKPVVASMADVAASGGYYIAVGADEIWAEPLTITGSIGVFVPKFSAAELYGKLGLHFDTVKFGQSADLFTTTRPYDDRERQMMQDWVDHFYGIFVDRVAENRHLTREQVDAVARGHVWLGQAAKERKLVDQLGGLEEAIASAKVRAGLRPDADVTVTELGYDTSPDLAQIASGPPRSQLDEALSLLGLPKREALQALRALRLTGESGTLRAVLPYVVEVH